MVAHRDGRTTLTPGEAQVLWLLASGPADLCGTRIDPVRRFVSVPLARHLARHGYITITHGRAELSPAGRVLLSLDGDQEAAEG